LCINCDKCEQMVHFSPLHNHFIRNNWDSPYCCTLSTELFVTTIIAPCNITIHILTIRNYRKDNRHCTIHTCTDTHTDYILLLKRP
jgi:hypothetical protein